MKLSIVFILILGIFSNLFAQNLLEERIRKITGRKKSIYLDKGIFHNGTVKVESKLTRVRHSYSVKQGYERVVFDFSITSELKFASFTSISIIWDKIFII